MEAFGKLKFKEMRKLIEVQDVSEEEFKLKGENVGLSLKYLQEQAIILLPNYGIGNYLFVLFLMSL